MGERDPGSGTVNKQETESYAQLGNLLFSLPIPILGSGTTLSYPFLSSFPVVGFLISLAGKRRKRKKGISLGLIVHGTDFLSLFIYCSMGNEDWISSITSGENSSSWYQRDRKISCSTFKSRRKGAVKI